MSKHWHLSAPITAHIEITNACNEKCVHCYNFDRDEFRPKEVISLGDLHTLCEDLVKNKIMHVIITGGEPTLEMDLLCRLAKTCLQYDISVSLNSNMVNTYEEKLNRIKDAGVNHILTTIHSDDHRVHDGITGIIGSCDKTLDNIQLADRYGIKITAQTVISNHNKNSVYSIGQYVNQFGIKKFLANRVIPSCGDSRKTSCVDKQSMLKVFDALLRLKKDYGMEVGTCRTVPQCLFPDLDKYKDFTNRGCSAGKKHIVIDPLGNARACVSEERNYGNIYEIGIKGVWDNMYEWRSMKYIPVDCQRCHLFESCDGGCRMVAKCCTDSLCGDDNLKVGFQKRSEKGFDIVRRKGEGAKVKFIDRA